MPEKIQKLTTSHSFFDAMNWRHALRFMTRGFSIGFLIVFMGACSRGEEAKTPTSASNLVSAPTNFTLFVPSSAQSAPTAPAMIERSYAVGKVGVLNLGFPREWNDTIRKV